MESLTKGNPDIPPVTYMWKSKDGRTMPIHEMKDNHLLNSIRMVRKNLEPQLREIARIQFKMDCEALLNGQEGSWDLKQVKTDKFTEKRILTLKYLELERERRGI